MKQNLSAVCKAWEQAKGAENNAKDARNILEVMLLNMVGVKEDLEGVKTIKGEDGLVLKITGKMSRKIDNDLLQEIAMEQGLIDSLSLLFRWKPELNMTEWKSASETITTPLLAAITTKPAKPSFAITFKEIN